MQRIALSAAAALFGACALSACENQDLAGGPATVVAVQAPTPSNGVDMYAGGAAQATLPAPSATPPLESIGPSGPPEVQEPPPAGQQPELPGAPPAAPDYAPTDPALPAAEL
jgi:hypothetical protein